MSTAKKTTEVSGRGVGLDIVKTNIETLNGSITTDYKTGEGTKFTLMLPLTLAILPALLVSTNRTICAIPLTNVIETAQLKSKNIQTIRGKEVTILRGNVLPLLRLNTTFNQEKKVVENIDKKFIVVVKAGGTTIGLVVDSLIEQQEIVMKSLGKYIGGVNGIAGASIMGDGQVVLILDILSLIRATLTENQN